MSSSNQQFSIPSIIAIIAAFLSFMTGAFWGMVLALVALLFGVIGVLLSLSPKVRGGLMGTISLVAGVIGVLAAIIKGLMWIFG